MSHRKKILMATVVLSVALGRFPAARAQEMDEPFPQVAQDMDDGSTQIIEPEQQPQDIMPEDTSLPPPPPEPEPQTLD